jgi:hypothetical protein
MAIQLSAAVRNARLDAIETAIGVSAILKIRTGSAPANVAAAATGTVLATLNLPSDWMAAASSGSKALSGSWTDSSADATGTAAHFEITATDGTTRHLQGTVTVTDADLVALYKQLHDGRAPAPKAKRPAIERAVRAKQEDRAKQVRRAALNPVDPQGDELPLDQPGEIEDV